VNIAAIVLSQRELGSLVVGCIGLGALIGSIAMYIVLRVGEDENG
jgi:hypothetical protein